MNWRVNREHAPALEARLRYLEPVEIGCGELAAGLADGLGVGEADFVKGKSRAV